MSSVGSNNDDANALDDWSPIGYQDTANQDLLIVPDFDEHEEDWNLLPVDSSAPTHGNHDTRHEGSAPSEISIDHDEVRRQRTPSTRDWAKHRNEMTQLYVHDRLELREVIEYMQQKYGFSASPRQYQERFRQWKARKNITDAFSREMGDQYQNRNLDLTPDQARRIGRLTYPDRLELSMHVSKSSGPAYAELTPPSLAFSRYGDPYDEGKIGLYSRRYEETESVPVATRFSSNILRSCSNTKLPWKGVNENLPLFYHDQSNVQGETKGFILNQTTRQPDIQSYPSFLNYDDSLLSDTLEKIRRFYFVCMTSIKYAKAVQNDCVDNESASHSSCNNKHEASGQRTSDHIQGKRKFTVNEPIPEPDNNEDTSIATKRIKQKQDLPPEFLCWWYVRNPQRYHTCANNCSRNRDLYSYRRHHFDEHWRWGDVESEGISFEVWNAAKHAACTRALTSSYAKDTSKWIHSYRILFRLSEFDTVPNPVCYMSGHIHLKPKRRIVQPLPSIQSARKPNELPTETLHLQPSEMVRPEPSFFPVLDPGTMCDPAMNNFDHDWTDRLNIAWDLLELNPQMTNLNMIVSQNVLRISELLGSMISAPHKVSCDSIRQICNYAIDFEKRYNQAIITSSSPSTQELGDAWNTASSPSSTEAAAAAAIDFCPKTAQTVDVTSIDQNVAHRLGPLQYLGNGDEAERQASCSEDSEEYLHGMPHQITSLTSTIDRNKRDYQQPTPMHDEDSINPSDWVFLEEDGNVEFGNNFNSAMI